MFRFLLLMIAVVSLSFVSVISFADDATPPAPAAGGPPQGGPHHFGPPKAAVDACSGKSKGDACGFTMANGMKISGQCFQHPGPDAAGKPVFCMPPHHGIMWKHPKTDEPGGSAGAPPAGGDAPTNPGNGAPKDVD